MSLVITKENVKLAETVVDTVEIDAPENNVEKAADNGMVKIVESIEARLIQEEIVETFAEYDNVKKPKWWKYALSIGLAPVTGIGTMAGSFVSSAEFMIIGFSVFLASFFVSPLLSMSITEKYYSKRSLMFKKIESLRKKLFEQSLKVELVKFNEAEVNDEWNEVMAFDENNDYVKYLVRIVKDDKTGFDNIEAKRLKG